MHPFKRKKNFLLIEVIIGIALFALCALPLIHLPFEFIQKNYESLFKADLSRHAEVVHCQILADLQSGQISWNSLPKEPKAPLVLSTTPCKIQLGKHIHRSFTQTTSIHLQSKKTIESQQEARLLEIKIVYKTGQKKSMKSYTFSYLQSTMGPSSPGNQTMISSG